ncbi:MAG: hypothetical protein IKT02_02205 [Bacteroidales bacterium]|nr:hypothetical protein [Bacteroidales bacterium]
MKKYGILLCAVAMLTVLTGCEKTGVKRFEGNYSYKTSGTIDIYASGSITITDSVGVEHTFTIDDTYTCDVITESGQMHIAETGKDAVVLTMNAMLGDVVVMDGVTSKKILTLKPTERIVRFNGLEMIDDLELFGNQTSQVLTVDAVGNRYDDILIFDMHYSGSWKRLGINFEITGSNVKTVATLNE